MKLTKDEQAGIDVALNESDLLGLEISQEKHIVGATFAVICANEKGEVPEDRRVQIIFSPVGRVVASLRKGRWDDKRAEVVQFSEDELLGVVQGFGGQPIYGWEFIDCKDKQYKKWKKRTSMEWRSGDKKGTSHTIDLFQESSQGEVRHLDIRIWFDDMYILNSKGDPITMQEFITNGKNGWDQVYEGNSHVTKQLGIFSSEMIDEAVSSFIKGED